MSAIINFSLKNQDGTYTNYTMSVNDKQDQYGNNASISFAQSKEEREQKKPKVFVGNGKVTWTDGTIIKAEWVDRVQNTSDKIRKANDDLPF